MHYVIASKHYKTLSAFHILQRVCAEKAEAQTPNDFTIFFQPHNQRERYVLHFMGWHTSCYIQYW